MYNSIEDAKQHGTYALVSIDLIDEDPDNRDLYGDYKEGPLSEEMKENGFYGNVLLYPNGDRYVLQSGHRTCSAAKKAGYKEIPAIIIDPPATDEERRIRLTLMNYHGRVYNPMVKARIIAYEMETYRMQAKRLRSEGSKPQKTMHQTIAQKLEISVSQITKYNSLLSLSKPLQKLVEEERVPWAVLSSASQLSESQQSMLYRRINGQLLLNPDGVTAAWLREEINECKHILLYSDSHYSELVNSLAEYDKAESEPKKNSKKLPKSVSLLEKSYTNMCLGLESAKEDPKKCLEILSRMQRTIEDHMKELKEYSS